MIQLPVININISGRSGNNGGDDGAVGKAMLEAATRYGFFYIDHDDACDDSDGGGDYFSVEDVDWMFELSKKFFSSPREEKAQYKIGPDNVGWSGMHTELLDPEHQRIGDFKEAMNFGDFKDGKAQQPLPPSLAAFEPDLNRFSSLCNKTCARILQLLALALEIPQTYFASRHGPSNGTTESILRFLFYPSLSSPTMSNYQHDRDVRAGAHSDYGSITLLFQRPGQHGLEILTPEGTWASVPVWPSSSPSSSSSSKGECGNGGERDDVRARDNRLPPILINIGDVLSYWTDGLLKSTVHRVVFPHSERDPSTATRVAANLAQDRYSIVFFCHPVDDTELVPVPSAVVATHRQHQSVLTATKVGYGGGAGSLQPGKRALTAKEHLEQRLAATYQFEKEGIRLTAPS
ncbi:hypothetical protein Egran_02170 [Elaphomyces granulatus]|uniref:Fe2OG dioxygenase domain-containing protein n=1 Tax=Elaphomyces granulatus TaxID=519963 RepID=A0A232M107_9EURO|nr:hypothetical protein Egran_02170 [Elaphomyces granulatus]